MKVTLTVKLSPESRGEMIDEFGAKYRAFRAYIEDLQAKGVLPCGNIRWLLDSARWETQDGAQ